MNIVLFARSLHPGGAERQLCLLATELAQRGHVVTVVVLYAGGVYETLIKNSNAQLKCLDKKYRWDWWCLFTLVRFIRQLKPDVIHSYLTGQNVLLGFMKSMFPRNTKIVFGVRVSEMPLHQYGWLDRVLSALEVVYSYFADLIIVNSKQGYQYAIKSGFRKKHLTVIQNGIDTDKFKFSDTAKSPHKALLSHALEKFKLIGLVGRIDPVKDQETLLKGAAILLQRRQDVRFLLVGGVSDAAYEEKLKTLIDKLGLVHSLTWLPAQTDMQAIYSALDILCLTSVSEGFPNVVAEAMACGVPCVVTDVGDAKEIVGELGAVVPKKDPDALAAMLDRTLSLIHDARQTRQRIVDNYSVRTMVDKTELALNALIGH